MTKSIRFALLACVFGVAARAQTSEVVLHSFSPVPPNGSFPYAGVIRDAAGNLYGTASAGGAANKGVVYKLDPTGHVAVLHSFGLGTDGASPYAGVAADGSGNLYGTTRRGGAMNAGIVYKVSAGGKETVLYSFTGGADGGSPTAGVSLDSAGNLYGTTVSGGAGYGVVYMLTPGGQETVLYTFQGGADGSGPVTGVIRDAAGNLYGAAPAGGAGYGVVYKLDTAGKETVLYSFRGGRDGSQPQAGLIRDAAGNLYGTAYAGGTAGLGVIYKLDTAGQETVLYSFPGGFSGGNPAGGVMRDAAGRLYGVAGGGDSGLGVAYVLYPNGNEAVLHSFAATLAPDGFTPKGNLVQDAAGNLYGTTYQGGAQTNACPYAGCGVVYKLSPIGAETLLYIFPIGSDGSFPMAGVARDEAGNLYGTTSEGGSLNNAGAVYKVTPAGEETVLYAFPFGPSGAFPYSGLTLDASGNLYGTTSAGGNNICPGLNGCGVVFEIGASGVESTLYAFSGPDGSTPYSGVVLDAAGNLYGTTFYGGAAGYCVPPPGGIGTGCGVVYRLSPAGQETVLYSFKGGNDGGRPYAGVVRDAAGNLYGTTWYGGTGACNNQNVGLPGCGVIFKLDPSGNETVLYNFSGGSDGANPNGLMLDANGNLYGTATSGGNTTSGNCQRKAGCGVVFKLDANGQFSVLYTFTGGDDGGTPQAGVVVDAAGNLYGTAYGAGGAQGGVVFEISPSGQETVLETFSGPNGFHPAAPVTLDAAGNLYGTTSSGGQQGEGVVFKIVRR